MYSKFRNEGAIRITSAPGAVRRRTISSRKWQAVIRESLCNASFRNSIVTRSGSLSIPWFQFRLPEYFNFQGTAIRVKLNHLRQQPSIEWKSQETWLLEFFRKHLCIAELAGLHPRPP